MDNNSQQAAVGANTESTNNKDKGNDYQMANNWDKFRLLMWKNGLLQWRHKFRTIMEILVPVLFSMMIISIRRIEGPKYYSQKNYSSFEIDKIDKM